MKTYKVIIPICLFIFNMTIAQASCFNMGFLTIENDTTDRAVEVRSDQECTCSNSSWNGLISPKGIKEIEARGDNDGIVGKCAFQGQYLWYSIFVHNVKLASVSFIREFGGGSTSRKVDIYTDASPNYKATNESSGSHIKIKIEPVKNKSRSH